MNEKKTRIINNEIEILNRHDFSHIPKFNNVDLSWNVLINENSNSISLSFVVPSQKLYINGTLENDDGEFEEIYFVINELPEVKVSTDYSTKLFPNDISPKSVEFELESILRVDDYTFDVVVKSLSVSF